MSKSYTVYIITVSGGDYAAVNAENYGLSKAIKKLIKKGKTEFEKFELRYTTVNFTSKKDRKNAIDLAEIYNNNDYDNDKHTCKYMYTEEEINEILKSM
jgi:ribosomal protein S9